MRVAVLHNDVPPDAPAADRDVLVQVEAVAASLVCCGHEPIVVPVSLDLRALADRLGDLRPDVVFNLVESLSGSDRLAFLVPGLLDALGWAYTGAPTGVIFQLSDKVRAKARLRQVGLPTPDWLIADGADPGAAGCLTTEHVSNVSTSQGHAGTVRYETALGHAASAPCKPRESAPSAARYILKPIWEHASFGMDAGAVVEAADPPTLRRQLAERERLLNRPCFAEAYIEGREFNLSVLAGPDGPEVLAPAEIDFSQFAAGVPRIVDYRAKWQEDSFEYRNTPRSFDFPALDQPLLESLAHLTRCCWRLFGLRGYARVDFRVDRRRRPWILEINANPCLSPDAGFAAALARSGISFAAAIERILADALRG